MVTYEVTERLVEYIKRLINPQKIILFGSYAYGNPNKDSDVDLLIVTEIENSYQRKQLQALLRKDIPPIGIGKDFIIITPQELETYKDIIGTVIYPALKWGKIIYERGN